MRALRRAVEAGIVKFELGGGVHCDLATLIDTRLLIQASSGGGKSWAIRRILEQTSGKVQQLVIDPEGEFHTLREKYDYVYAAPHGGDTVAHPRSAALLAERLLELGASAILDIFELKPPTRREFVRRFLEALVEVPKRLYHPVIVVLDEAHDYAPEGQKCESTAAVVDEASRGRKRGQCLILATQRISKLSKDAAAELKNRMIGGTFLDVDIKRAGDELGADKKAAQQLRELDAGQFWAFGPALVRAPTLMAVGPVATTHPKPGARLTAPVPPTPERVKALLPKLADLPAEAEQRQRTADELKRDLAQARATITRLERMAPARVETTVETKIERIEVPILSNGDAMALREAVRGLQDVFRGCSQLAERLVEASGQVAKIGQTIDVAVARATGPDSPARRPLPVGGGRSPTASQPSAIPRSRVSQRTTSHHTAAERGAPTDEPLTGPEQRILDAIAWLESIGNSEPEQVAVAFLAGYRYGGGAFNNPRGRLRSRGLVDYVPGDRIQLTDTGHSAAQAPDEALTIAALHERVLTRLPGPEQKLLAALLAAYPGALSDAELAERAGYTPGAGAFNNPKGRLRSLGLIDYPQPRHAVARPLLFLEGT